MGLTEPVADASAEVAAAAEVETDPGLDDDGKAAPPASASEPVVEAPARTTLPRPTMGPSPGSIAADDKFGVAGRKAMWVQVGRLLKVEPSLRDRKRTDDLKRYRVATRRLRAALRLFADAYPDGQVRALRASLGDLGRAAGAVRDLDVHLADLERWARDGGDGAEAAVAPLRAAWVADRERALGELLARIDTKRHARLVRDLVAFVEGDGRLTIAGTRTVRDSAASRLWRSLETLREAGALVRWADLPAVHEVRIDAKRLRYGLEFLADVLPAGRELLVQRLVALQDHLGALNDAAVTATAVRAFLADRRVTLSPAERATIARYAADNDRELARLRRGIGRPWRPIASVTFARRLSRTVVLP